MSDWTAANLKLRADRDALNEAKRREAEASADRTFVDCSCTVGTLCRHNAACPRQKALAAARKAAQQSEGQRQHRAEAG